MLRRANAYTAPSLASPMLAWLQFITANRRFQGFTISSVAVAVFEQFVHWQAFKVAQNVQLGQVRVSRRLKVQKVCRTACCERREA